MGFTTAAFIRRNTPELRKKLDELGYRLFGAELNEDLCIFTEPEYGLYSVEFFSNIPHPDETDSVDCGTNEELFLAIAALRDDTNYMQWFVCTSDYKEFDGKEWKVGDFDLNTCSDDFDNILPHWRKATVNELIEHFKEKRMKAHVMKLENNCVIVDEEYFNEIKKESEFNQEKINEIAEERFLKYVKESGIKLSYKVNDIPYLFHHDLLYEINYDERGYPESVLEKVKYVIADDITEALNDKFKGLKDEALNYAISEFDKQKHGLEATAKIWKCLALIFSIMTIVSVIALFI